MAYHHSSLSPSSRQCRLNLFRWDSNDNLSSFFGWPYLMSHICTFSQLAGPLSHTAWLLAARETAENKTLMIAPANFDFIDHFHFQTFSRFVLSSDRRQPSTFFVLLGLLMWIHNTCWLRKLIESESLLCESIRTHQNSDIFIIRRCWVWPVRHDFFSTTNEAVGIIYGFLIFKSKPQQSSVWLNFISISAIATTSALIMPLILNLTLVCCIIIRVRFVAN